MSLKRILLPFALMILTVYAAWGAYANIDDFRQIPGRYNRLITKVMRHSSGMIWLGTPSGLMRYDGYSVSPAPVPEADSSQVVREYIIDMCEDSEGRIWLNSQIGFGIYDPATHHMRDDMAQAMLEIGVPDLPTVVKTDDHSNLWIATENGFYRLRPGEKKAEAVTGPGLPPDKVSAIAFQGSTPVLVDETGALRWIDPLEMKVTAHAEPGPAAKQHGKQTYLLTIDNKNRYWVYSTSAIDLYDGKRDQWISDRLDQVDFKGNPRSIYQSKIGNLWIAYDNHGLVRIDEDNSGHFHFNTIDRKGSFTHDITITNFLEDRPGNVWLGTYKKGLLLQNEFVRKFYTEPVPDMNCLLPEGKDKVWLGTDNRGLWLWDLETGSTRQVPDPTEGDAPTAITALARSKDGTIYVGAFYRGLRTVQGGKLVRTLTDSALDNAYIWALAADDAGNIWAGTLGDGIFRIDTRTGKAEKTPETSNALQFPYIQTAEATRDGKVFFGSTPGVAYYDPADGMIHNLKSLYPNFDSDNWRVTQILEDSRGLLWVATTKGLKVVDRKNGIATEVASADGTPLYASVFGLTEDNEGSMWVSEERAFSNLKVNYDKSTGDISFTIRHYDTRDGLMDSDFNQRSFAKLPSGEILVGGLDGVNRFIPSEIAYNTSRPTVIFTDIYLDGYMIHPGEKVDGHTVISSRISDGISVPPGSHRLTICFSSDNYAIPEKTIFSYRLEGYTDEWRTLPEGQHEVSYTNLSPGNYRLLVRAVNSDGYESEIPGILPVSVTPPFWLSFWAIAIYVILGIALVWFIFRILSLREKRRLRKKSDEENRRKQEELNQIKFRFFTNVSHDLRTPLSLIVSPLDEMLKEEHEPRQKRRLELMKNNATKLLTLVNQLLDFRKAEMAELQLNPKQGDIVEFSRNICQAFEAMADRKNIQLSFHAVPESLRMPFDYDKLEKIYMNLLGNAFKFTPAGGEVDVTLEHASPDAPNVVIRVADTGCGIADKDKPHIFDRFFQADDNGKAHENMGSGLGLSLVNEYVRLHNGSIRVEDNNPKGCVFICELPLKQQAAGAVANTDASLTPNNFTITTAAAAAAATGWDGTETKTKSNNPKVLIVDDNPDMREMLKFELSDEFDIRTAPDGERAISDIKRHKPDLVLTDLMMPGIDGIELCRHLRSNPKTVAIPLIIITAKHDLGMKIEGLTLGADDYITKPFNMDVLRLRMKRFLELAAKGATRTLIDPEPTEIKITPLDEKLMEKAMDYVSENIDNSDLTVEQLSDYLGMSRVRLYKKIKQLTGKTPIEFIRIIRLKRAAQMLRESQLNVSEIAYRTGFNSPKLFSKYFKEEFGILPSHYQSREAKEPTVEV